MLASERITTRVVVSILASCLLASGAVAQGRVANWTLTPVVTVGDESSNVVLERVRSLQLLRDGRLLVADVGAKTVFVIDSAGKSKPPLGREGAGPGEYRSPTALATIGDTIAVLDPANTRIGLFNGRGEWQGSWISERISGDGVRLFRTGGAQFFNYGTRRVGNALRTAYIRYDASGARDTIVPDPFPPSEYGATCGGPNGGIHFFSSKFQPRQLRIPGADNTILDGLSDSYRLVQRKVNGDIVATFAGTATRIVISDTAWENSIVEFREFVKKNTAGQCNRSGLVRPSAMPVVRAAWWDDAGRLWVERYHAKGFAFDVFSKTGVLVATMPAPERNEEVEPNVVGNRIVLLTTSGDGVPVVRVYRIAVGR